MIRMLCIAAVLVCHQSIAAAEDNHVWLDLTQEELDAAYDQSVYAANLEQVLARQAANSQIARAKLGKPFRYNYGSTPNEGMDVYISPVKNAPIHIFIHGGTWRYGVAANNAFAAELFVNGGAHFIVPDFDSVDDHDGDLVPLVDQLRKMLIWVHANARYFGGDSDQIFLSGFSSGAHLASLLLATPWSDYQLPVNVLKGVLLSSGMYDITLLVAEEYNHFEIIETLGQPYGVLGRAALAQMGLRLSGHSADERSH